MSDDTRRAPHRDGAERTLRTAGGAELPTCSVLFPGDPAAVTRGADPPQSPFLHDLNLDRVFASINRGRQEYELSPYFHTRLTDADAIAYRHEVMQDLEDESLREAVRTFANGMKGTRRSIALSHKLPYAHEKQVWSLYAAQSYAEAVTGLAAALASAVLRSRGLVAFRAFLVGYAGSAPFTELTEHTRRVLDEVAQVRSCLHIEGSSITVTACDETTSDLSAEVRRTFARFRECDEQSPAEEEAPSVGLDHIEAAVVERIARLHPEIFSDLEQTSRRVAGFLDDTVTTFDREVQFYLAYLDHTQPMRRAGLQFTYPEISDTSKEVRAGDTFDLALAGELGGGAARVVRNDFSLSDPERVLMVTGANQGGKTTFARTFGQLHYLAALGLPVPGRKVRLHAFDRLLTHFPRRERLEDLRGRLEDELVRVHDVLEQATPDSIVIFNELFGSTKLRDATALAATVLERIERLDLLCVFVTFLDELAAEPVRMRVSLVAGVDPEDPSVRTFKVVRQPAEGRAHAFAIAEKYQLDHASLRKRITG